MFNVLICRTNETYHTNHVSVADVYGSNTFFAESLRSSNARSALTPDFHLLLSKLLWSSIAHFVSISHIAMVFLSFVLFHAPRSLHGTTTHAVQVRPSPPFCSHQADVSTELNESIVVRSLPMDHTMNRSQRYLHGESTQSTSEEQASFMICLYL
jgi:hypothetical protein